MAEKKSAAKPATSKPTGKQVAPPRDPQTLPIEGKQGESMPIAKAKATTKASINAVLVVNAFQGNIMGKDVDMGELVTGMQTKFKDVNDGDLSTLEAMLVSQGELSQFAQLELFSIDDVFGGWAEAQKQHFDEGGTFDEIYGVK